MIISATDSKILHRDLLIKHSILSDEAFQIHYGLARTNFQRFYNVYITISEQACQEYLELSDLAIHFDDISLNEECRIEGVLSNIHIYLQVVKITDFFRVYYVTTSGCV